MTLLYRNVIKAQVLLAVENNLNFLPFFSSVNPRQLDLGFVVDSSDKVNWSQMLGFVSSLLSSFDIAYDRTRVGFIVYSDRTTVSFPFNALKGEAHTLGGIRQLINNIPQQGGNERRIDQALSIAHRDLFGDAGGTRPRARKVCRHSCLQRMKPAAHSVGVFLFAYVLREGQEIRNSEE